MAHAHAQSAQLRAGHEELRHGEVKLALVFAAYERHRSVSKGPSERGADARRTALWSRFLGGDRDPATIRLADWESFRDMRRSGVMDGRGVRVPAGRERPLRIGTVAGDLKWLCGVLEWATRWRTRQQHYLLASNPVRGFPVPRAKDVRRPVASSDRFEALRAVADRVMMRITWHGKPETVRSHLAEVLDLAHGTGRRLGAILRLTYADLRLDRTVAAPHGAIRWPARTDKTGRTTEAPVTPAVRAALDRVMHDRPGMGAAPLFPAAKDPSVPTTRWAADRWLRKAEELAGLEPQDGTLWHSLRRGWATARKHWPAADVAAAGGWADTATLMACYTQADPGTTLRVVLEPAELREVQR
jgi:integrase